jgi:serine/threonine protein kinase
MAYRTRHRRNAALLLAAFGGQACATETAFACALALAGALVALALCVCLARRTSAPKLGQYILGAQIGAGNMGAVYSARHATLGHGAAIKVLHPERSSARDRARFAREVELTRRLSHANTVSILDSGIGPDGAPYFAMEYVEGVDLQTLVEREGPLPAARAIGILSQVSAALSSAHVQGIVHRDIKPANIMVTARGADDHVKLVDFGLAQIQGATETLANDADTISGTPLYLAPEAITAPDAIDPRADLYALGAVGYFLLTGQHVFSGYTLIELFSKHLYEMPIAPSQRSARAIPEALEAIVLACLAKSPSARPASAAALQSALLACSERTRSDVAVSSVQRASNVELEALEATRASMHESHPVLQICTSPLGGRASTGGRSSSSTRRAHAHFHEIRNAMMVRSSRTGTVWRNP